MILIYLRLTIKFPQNLDDIKDLASTLKKYKTEHIGYVVLLFCCAILYKQSFAIPGSFMMVSFNWLTNYLIVFRIKNILGGAIFGVSKLKEILMFL